MSRLRRRGFALVELLVAMLIGSILVIAVLVVLPRAGDEPAWGRGRGGSHLDRAGAASVLELDEWIRSAGSGLAQTVRAPATDSYAYGCRIFASKDGTQRLPVPGRLPAPFAGLAPDFRLLPVLILPGATRPGAANAVTPGHVSDAIVVMSSGSGSGGVPVPFSAAAADGRLSLSNGVAFSGGRANDMVLVADPQDATATDVADCMVEQVAAKTADGAAAMLTLGGPWAADKIGSQRLAAFPPTAVAVDLGDPSPGSGQAPQFLVIGVGDNDTLYSYDLLGARTPALQARGGNVFEMHAIYGVDSDGDGAIDAWVPADTGRYAASALTAGTPAAARLAKRIKAIRVGLILRSDLPDPRAAAAAGSKAVTLFAGLADVDPSYARLAYTRTFTGAERHYRYRTVEATIPVRNNAF